MTVERFSVPELREFGNGKKVLDFRDWIKEDGSKPYPTKRGYSVPAYMLGDLVDLLYELWFMGQPNPPKGVKYRMEGGEKNA